MLPSASELSTFRLKSSSISCQAWFNLRIRVTQLKIPIAWLGFNFYDGDVPFCSGKL